MPATPFSVVILVLAGTQLAAATTQRDATTTSPPASTLAAPLPAVSARTPAAPHARASSVLPFASVDEGLGIASEDGSYSSSLHMVVQTRFEHIESEASRQSGFRVGMARPALRGVAVRKWLSYFVQWELAGTVTLLDAEIVAQPAPEIGVKVGQFVTPFTREFLVPPFLLLFPDFAPSNILFRSGRDAGAMLLGQVFDKRLEYFAAAVNGNGLNRGGNDNAQLAWIGRLGVNVVGRHPYSETPQLSVDSASLALGTNASYAETEATTTTLDAQTGTSTVRRLGSAPTTKLGADVVVHAGPVSFASEIYTRTVRTASGGREVARGGFAQGGVFVVPRTIELAARLDLVDLDAYRGGTLDKRLDGAATWYVRENHLKLQLRYAYADSPNAIAPSPKGTSSTLSLQAQLWF